MAGFYGGIAGCAMIGQTIVNVEMGKGRSRISTLAAGIVLLVLVTALSEVMAKIPMAVLAGIMAIVAVKTFSWHSVQPGTLKNAPVAETVVMLVTVVATVYTGNTAIGVLGGIVMMFILLPDLSKKHWLQKKNRRQSKKNKETAGIGNGGDHHARPHRGVAPQPGHRQWNNHAHHRRHQQVQHHRQHHDPAQRHIIVQPPGNAAHDAAPDRAVNQRDAHLPENQPRKITRLNVFQRPGRERSW